MLKKSDLTPYHQDLIAGKICPYCKSGTVIKTEIEIYGRKFKGRKLIACKNHPHCDSYVGTHDDGTALGRLSNHNHRIKKKNTHAAFDPIWQNGYIERGQLYKELSEYLELDPELTNMGYMGIETLEKTYQWALNKYVEVSRKKS